MNSIRVAACLAAMVTLGCSIPADKREIADLKEKNQALQQKSQALQQKLEGLEMQEKCAVLAERSFNSMPKEKYFSKDYTCHFNRKQNKFFISITTVQNNGLTARMIVDLLENHTIASYLWNPVKGKKYWEVKPMYCVVNGERKDWTTEDYDAFEKSCMTD